MKKIIGGYLLRKPNIRLKIEFWTIVPKNVKGDILRYFTILSVAKKAKWKSKSAKKFERGTLFLWNVFYFTLEASNAFKIKNEVLLVKCT